MQEAGIQTVGSGWEDLRDWAASFLAGHPALQAIASDSVALLHGSTTQGIDDAYSDLDIWLLTPREKIAALDGLSETRFFEFRRPDKPGHFNVHAEEEFAARVAGCDLPLIAELRRAVVLFPPRPRPLPWLDAARRSMPEAVRAAWFRYHYVEMRSEHRACDTPIERGDPVAVLLALTQTLAHALRAAMVLDGEPYPYVKWLSRESAQTPTGRRLAPLVTDILDLLGRDALRLPGPEKQYPLSTKLREIRLTLIEAARAQGLDGPWLDAWYLYLDVARQGIREATWM